MLKKQENQGKKPKGVIRRIMRASQTSEIEVKVSKFFFTKYSEVFIIMQVIGHWQIKKKFNSKYRVDIRSFPFKLKLENSVISEKQGIQGKKPEGIIQRDMKASQTCAYKVKFYLVSKTKV